MKLYVITTLFEGAGYNTNAYSHVVENVESLKDYLRGEIEDYQTDWNMTENDIANALDCINEIDKVDIPVIYVNSRNCYLEFKIQEYMLKPLKPNIVKWAESE